MNRESRLSSWARRGAVLVAALASVATSAPEWQLAAKAPAGAPAGGSGTRMTVEASQEPLVYSWLHANASSTPTLREESTPWGGRGTYYLPPGFEPRVSITGGTCSRGGGMCSACEPPLNAYVRIARLEPVAPWSLSATGDELTARIDASGAPRSFVVRVEATGRVELEAVLTGGDGAKLEHTVTRDSLPAVASLIQFTVGWSPRDAHPEAATEVRWRPRATIYGYCQGEGECRAPAGASVKIVAVTPP